MDKIKIRGLFIADGVSPDITKESYKRSINKCWDEYFDYLEQLIKKKK